MKYALRISVLALAAFFAVLGGTALAASPNTIYRDAADGSIDGNYSLSDLRAADAAISADQREYILWDEVYAAAIERASTPDAPKPRHVKPTDMNGNGQIDPSERAKAAEATRKLNKVLLKKVKAKKPAATATTETDDTIAASPSSNDDDDGGDTNWPLIVLIAAIIVIALVGIWRVIATRTKPDEHDAKTDGRFGARDDDMGTGPGPRR
jgi:hypothetical protein